MKCPGCGREVCVEHQVNGLCLVCSQTQCAICGEKPAIGYCVLCGRLGCDECLVQIDNVRRVCIECIRGFGGIEPVRRRLALARKIVRPGIPEPASGN